MQPNSTCTNPSTVVSTMSLSGKHKGKGWRVHERNQADRRNPWIKKEICFTFANVKVPTWSNTLSNVEYALFKCVKGYVGINVKHLGKVFKKSEHYICSFTNGTNMHVCLSGSFFTVDLIKKKGNLLFASSCLWNGCLRYKSVIPFKMSLRLAKALARLCSFKT